MNGMSRGLQQKNSKQWGFGVNIDLISCKETISNNFTKNCPKYEIQNPYEEVF